MSRMHVIFETLDTVDACGGVSREMPHILLPISSTHHALLTCFCTSFTLT